MWTKPLAYPVLSKHFPIFKLGSDKEAILNLQQRTSNLAKLIWINIKYALIQTAAFFTFLAILHHKNQEFRHFAFWTCLVLCGVFLPNIAAKAVERRVIISRSAGFVIRCIQWSIGLVLATFVLNLPYGFYILSLLLLLLGIFGLVVFLPKTFDSR